MPHRPSGARLGAVLAGAVGVALAATATASPALADSAPHGHRYYLDCSADGGPGDGSHAHPWTSLAQAGAHRYGPGDQLRIARGTTCTGTLAPTGAGSAAAPIRIGAYGTGALPHLEGGGLHDTVLLRNMEYVEVRDLEITNSGGTPGTERNGVRLELADHGIGHHYVLSGLDVHAVRGGDFKTLTGSSGIQIDVAGTTTASAFDDLRITGNRIRDVDREGIYFKSTFSRRDLVGDQQDPKAYPGPWTPSTRVRIDHNTLTSIAGDAMKLDTTSGAVVEHNRVDGFQLRSKVANAGIWTFNTDDTLIQYNEVSGGGNSLDGMSFDADGASNHTVFQYNYSHDNKGGFLLNCPYSGAKTVDVVARYNISHNDGARLLQNCWGPILNTQIYNNTFLNKEAVPTYLVQDDAGSPATTRHELTVRDNIFAGPGDTATDSYRFKNPTPDLHFDHNVLYGIPGGVPANTDGSGTNPGGSTADPKLIAALAGADAADPGSLRVAQGSSALGLGVPVPDAGRHDYFGFPIPKRHPAAGAYQGPPVR
ncbi:right-handed parallel beta-helix repeat-containing protein [Streptomyces sp. NPDC057611]|uniref:right-handed parallel beta-helix repeat-containing protein n=1 Tax=Streptomyces sp. NPDC057611 TaxID=3346182 RepID=UPI00367F3331